MNNITNSHPSLLFLNMGFVIQTENRQYELP
jgi:hypothetical protein